MQSSLLSHLVRWVGSKLNCSSARCESVTKTTSGRSEPISAAAAVGHSNSRSKVKKSLIATGIVLMWLSVSTSGTRKRFQFSTKTIHAVAISPGATTGRTIHHRICAAVAPSRWAASSDHGHSLSDSRTGCKPPVGYRRRCPPTRRPRRCR